MAKPPKATPSSDIEGVDRDRTVDDIQESGSPDPGQQLKDSDDENKAKPPGTDHTQGDSE